MNQNITPSHPPEFPVPVIGWDTVRETVGKVKQLGRVYLYGQVWLGWQLSVMKESFSHGGDRRSSGQNVHLKSWAETCEEETGLQRKTADRLIALFEATKAKLKRLKGPIVTRGTLIIFERENPLSISEEDHGDLLEIIASLCEGETQASLMQELGIIPKPKNMPKGTKGGKDDEPTAGQLAFHFFEAMVAPLINSRTNPDYRTLLYALPVTSDEDHPLSLATIEAECRAMLADIEDAKKASAKPAKGRVVG